MKQALHQAFQNLSEKNPPSYLEGAILRKIELERSKQVKKKLFLSYVGSVISIIAVFYTVLSSGVSFIKSDFWNIFSLFFSDMTIVAQYWKDFVLSLLETFPLAHTIVMIVPIFTLLLSLNLYMKWHRKNTYRMWKKV